MKWRNSTHVAYLGTWSSSTILVINNDFVNTIKSHEWNLMENFSSSSKVSYFWTWNYVESSPHSWFKSSLLFERKLLCTYWLENLSYSTKLPIEITSCWANQQLPPLAHNVIQFVDTHRDESFLSKSFHSCLHSMHSIFCRFLFMKVERMLCNDHKFYKNKKSVFFNLRLQLHLKSKLISVSVWKQLS